MFIAPRNLVARLPQKLLSLEKGGALAVIGHVDRAWSYSFVWAEAGQQIETFQDMLTHLLRGHPIGWAMEHFNNHHAALSVELSKLLTKIQKGNTTISDKELATAWTSSHDARNYIIIGDPAVRLPLHNDNTATMERPEIEFIDIVKAPRIEPDGDFTKDPKKSETPEDFGLLDSMKSAQKNLRDALEQFSNKLSDTLKQAAVDLSSLEVSTYVSDDMADVAYQNGELAGNAQRRIYTHISLDGDANNCIRETAEEGTDQALLTLHDKMVERALAQRAEMIKIVVSGSKELLSVLKAL